VFDWIDEWDFKNCQTKQYTHGFHTYPATFIPQIARKLISVFSTEGDTVCDIFCGSGTTLVESSLLNRNAIGIELNPLAVLIAKVKTTPVEPAILKSDLIAILSCYNDIEPQNCPDVKNAEFWYPQGVIEQLSKLKQSIWQLPNRDSRDFFSVCFSEVSRIVSYTQHGRFKLQRDKRKLNAFFLPDVLGEFVRISQKNILGMEEYIRDVSRNVTVKIIEGDATKDNGIEPDSVDLIVTSPPYGDSRTTVAYGQFSRLPSQWLGLLPDGITDIDKELLGGRNSVGLDAALLELSETLKLSIGFIADRDESRAKEVLSFYSDLFRAMQQAVKTLKPGKYFCLITGNRTVKGLVLKTDEIICEFGEHLGLARRGILYRNILNKRTPLKNSPTNEPGKTGHTMTKESIVLLKKD